MLLEPLPEQRVLHLQGGRLHLCVPGSYFLYLSIYVTIYLLSVFLSFNSIFYLSIYLFICISISINLSFQSCYLFILFIYLPSYLFIQENYTGPNCEVSLLSDDCGAGAGVCSSPSACAVLIKGGFICENCTQSPFYNQFCQVGKYHF